MRKLWETVNLNMITINANSSLLIISKNHQYQTKKSRPNRDFKFHIQAYFTSTGTEI